MSFISPATSRFKFSCSTSPLSFDPKPLSLLLQGPLSPPHLLQIHARAFRLGAHQDNLLAARLIGRYHPLLALRVLRLLTHPNIFPFNAAIRVLAESGFATSAFSVFRSLRFQSLSPNDLTFSFLFKACFHSQDVRHVQQLHTHVAKFGFDSDAIVCNGLLSVYAKSVGDLVSARKLFEEMADIRMVSSWTCLMTGYAQSGKKKEVLELFVMMVEENLRLEDDTMVSILSACSGLEIEEIESWVSILSGFGKSCDDALLDSVDTVLIYLYGKLGEIERSRGLFDEMIRRGRRKVSIVAWNAMIGGYVQNGHSVEALDLFREMMSNSDVKANHVTIVSVLSACAIVGDLDLGRWAYSYLKSEGRKGILECNKILATAFIDMFSKCGSLEEAKEIFNGMARRDVVSFNAMIMGLAMNGEGEKAMSLFSEMERVRINPNDGTFLGLLCACNHSGLVAEGRTFFRTMYERHNITPKLEHYASFIDLLGRAGHVNEALEVVKSMRVEPNGLVWGALLGACLLHSRVDVAREIATKLSDSDPDNSAGYVMLSNLYADHRRWGDIAALRGLMKVRGVSKQPGCSWISIDGAMHEFQVGSTSHPQLQEIQFALFMLSAEMKWIGQ